MSEQVHFSFSMQRAVPRGNVPLCALKAKWTPSWPRHVHHAESLVPLLWPQELWAVNYDLVMSTVREFGFFVVATGTGGC